MAIFIGGNKIAIGIFNYYFGIDGNIAIGINRQVIAADSQAGIGCIFSIFNENCRICSFAQDGMMASIVNAVCPNQLDMDLVTGSI